MISVEQFLARDPSELSFDTDAFDLAAFNAELEKRFASEKPRNTTEAKALVENVFEFGEWSFHAKQMREGAKGGAK